MTPTQPAGNEFFPLLILAFALTIACGVLGAFILQAKETEQRNSAIAAAFTDQSKMTAIAAAGYRLRAERGGPIEAHCNRSNGIGPLPCDPLPQLPGVDIRIVTR
ncbi:hypothetical protein [Bosea sp. ANAM02]|uniref:hypothetical protein n=1 Tax=Bosea sp. ANAM02 TaxID=2020412 RepID=UPI00140EB7B4|nr:hypothetical protein [Bosea sp. ANAM02]BCB22335.1 hypothetical protein OCUBac02_52290 [Bosea sp. ANAM02]